MNITFASRLLRRLCVGLVLAGGTLFHSAPAPAADATGQLLTYVGTYTGARSKGIYVSRLEVATGRLSPPELAVETTSPSFLAIHPNRRFLYAVGEVGSFGGKPSGAVSAFAIDPQQGRLKLINQASSGGAGPCHLVVDQAGKNVLVANYGGGSVAVLPIKDDGSLSEPSCFIQHTGSSVNPQRQKEPHAHSINLDPANRFAFVADLGLDKVLIYRFDGAQGTLTANDPAFARVAPGSGPRHFTFHPTGRFAYVINEMLCTMTAFSYDAARGALKEVQTISTLPSGESVQPGYSTAEVVAHPSGKFLYGSNRGHNTIVAFAIDQASGKLTHVENQSTQGKTPRNFAIDPTGRWLLAENQDSGTIVVFGIDAQSGQLEPTDQVLEVPTPVCVRFVAAR
jgi:6-phosphogluconolactonase